MQNKKTKTRQWRTNTKRKKQTTKNDNNIKTKKPNIQKIRKNQKPNNIPHRGNILPIPKASMIGDILDTLSSLQFFYATNVQRTNNLQ